MTRVSEPGGVLVAHSYFLRHDDKQWRRMKPYPPLATLIAAACLRERGHRVELFDAMLSSGVEAFEALLDEARPRVVALIEDNFNFLTKMCTLRMRDAALRMVAAARERGCRVAVNGSDVTDHPELYLGAGADAVILGDVEPTLVELVDHWLAHPFAPPDRVGGLALPAERVAAARPQLLALGAATGAAAAPKRPLARLRPAAHSAHGSSNGGRATPGCREASGSSAVHYTPPRPSVLDLDALPFPAWDLVDVETYRSAWVGAHGRLSWNMVASRGCPYKCNWCAKPVFGKRYTQRSPGSVAEELSRLRRDVAPDHIWFADDIFGLTPAWIREFADEVTRRGARTPFTMQSRVNLMTPTSVAALAEAGAEEVWLGVESGSQKILDAMEKGSTIQQIRSATRTLKEHGIRSCWFIQLGYLGEDWEDLVRTRELIRDEGPDDIGVSVSYPLPGTRFHEMVREHLGPKRNWVDTDDLDMMFHGTYTTDFYRRIRTLLHEEVDARGNGGAARFNAIWAQLASEQRDHRNASLP